MGEAAKEVKPFVSIYVPNVLSTTRFRGHKVTSECIIKTFYKEQKPEQLMAGVFALYRSLRVTPSANISCVLIFRTKFYVQVILMFYL
jgi:hypothetical protein